MKGRAFIDWLRGTNETDHVCLSNEAWAILADAVEENAALREQLAERDAENSKLRSALEIVHFKREPWQ